MNNSLTAKQTAKLNSYQAVETHVEANASIISPIPAFQETYLRIKANINAIRQAAQEKSAPLSGITAGKADARQRLSELSVNIAGLVYAYASTNGDLALRDEMDVTPSQLKRTRDANLAPLCQNIHDKAQTNLAELAAYNLNAAKLAELQAAINAFTQAAPQPRAALSTRKTTNSTLETLFRDTDAIFENQFDPQIESLRQTQPDFVNTYFSNRIIVDPPTRARKTEENAKKSDDKK